MLLQLVPTGLHVRLFSQYAKALNNPPPAVHYNYSTQSLLKEEKVIPEYLTQSGRFKINFTLVGSGDHVILGLPGHFGTIEKDFQPIISRLNKKRFTIVTWDAPGFGKSQLVDSGQGFRKMTPQNYKEDAQMAAQLMKDLAFDRYSILGWSRGACTGVHLINAHPEKITKFCSWAAPAYTDEHGVRVASTLCNLDQWPSELIQPLIDQYGEQMLQDMLIDTKEYVTETYRTGNFQMTSLLPKVPQIPTLIIHGQDDMTVPPAHGHFYHEHLPNSKLEIWKGSTHYLHLENPGKFVKRSERFLFFDR